MKFHHSLLPVSLVCLLSACAPTEEIADVQAESGASSSLIQEIAAGPIIQSPISVDNFRTMTLSGTDLVIGRVLEQNSAYVKHYITYKSNGLLISGTFSIPKGDGPFPLIIQNHGYIDPDIYTNGRGLRREQDAMARAGLAVLHTDYRGHAESDPNPTEDGLFENGLGYAVDSANAILAVREWNDPRIDTEHVGMIGHSMGGGVTLQNLVTRPDLVDAAVLYAPVNSDAWKNFDRWNRDEDYADRTLIAFGGTREEAPESWDALSPGPSLANITTPILLFHGLLDEDVPVEWSADLNFQLETLGKDIRYLTYPKEGHEFSVNWKHFIDTSITFFNEHLRK